MVKYTWFTLILILLCALLGYTKLAFAAYAIIEMSYAISPLCVLLLIVAMLVFVIKMNSCFLYFMCQLSILPLLSTLLENIFLIDIQMKNFYIYPTFVLIAMSFSSLLYILKFKNKLDWLFLISIIFCGIFIAHFDGIL